MATRSLPPSSSPARSRRPRPRRRPCCAWNVSTCAPTAMSSPPPSMPSTPSPPAWVSSRRWPRTRRRRRSDRSEPLDLVIAFRDELVADRADLQARIDRLPLGHRRGGRRRVRRAGGLQVPRSAPPVGRRGLRPAHLARLRRLPGLPARRPRNLGRLRHDLCARYRTTQLPLGRDAPVLVLARLATEHARLRGTRVAHRAALGQARTARSAGHSSSCCDRSAIGSTRPSPPLTSTSRWPRATKSPSTPNRPTPSPTCSRG